MIRPLVAAAAGCALGGAALYLADHTLAGSAPRPADAAAAEDDEVEEALATADPRNRAIWRERFPNVELQTHDGRTVRFYDDLIEGKTVGINFFYVGCKDF